MIALLLTAGLAAGAPQRVDFSACDEVHRKLGQLFYANVDAFQYDGKEKINPEYVKMVRDLNIGGVIPHPADGTYQEIEASMHALQDASRAPLLIGVDSEVLRTTADQKAGSGAVTIGFGVYMGTIGDFGTKFPVECAERIGYLEAFLHRAMGFNQALGPTIEHSPRRPFLGQDAAKVASVMRPLITGMDEMGLRSTLKHYPYTPDSYDLHDQSKDTRLSPGDVDARLEIFGALAPSSGIVMSTHLYNSRIDPRDVATFSPTWIKRLREKAGFDGLVMTDGLYMLHNYASTMRQMSAKWDPRAAGQVKREASIFAIRAILAGHDLVLLEGNATQTRDVFNDVEKVACLDTKVGRDLRARILESSDRIAKYKEKNQDSLRRRVTVPEALVNEAKAFEFEPPCESRDESVVEERIGGKIKRSKIPGNVCPPDMWANAPICRDKEGFERLRQKITALGIVPVHREDESKPSGAPSPDVAR